MPGAEAMQQTLARVRSASGTAATKMSRVMELDPQPGMWSATGTAIAHAPNLDDLRSPYHGGDNITFDEHGHSAREISDGQTMDNYFPSLQDGQPRNPTMTELGSTSHSLSKEPLSNDQSDPTSRRHEKAPWPAAFKHALTAFAKFFCTPTGFFITIYGLNVVAWGAMLFFLLLKAAPAMNHPDGGDADSSPRKIWIEIDSQILNALFCLTSWVLAPWRFRDLYWLACWRLSVGPERGLMGLKRLAARNDSWFRLRDCDIESFRDESSKRGLTFSGKVASPTAGWKLDFVIWMMVLNTLFQVGMAFMMWNYNRVNRPPWGAGLFIGLGCGSSMFAGIMSWWEGRKIKIIEGPKIIST
ncbi:hypothetical protein B9Z65_4937 [Elsinoe australis]|uniref:Uncharacterized protein n=1 Tax=Elsinoe australis TaxID=40998 RepID=A0A2P8A6F8_9PEZI|nr:hypothetical protein B9Z65_4937 [Elsinoe australis]